MGDQISADLDGIERFADQLDLLRGRFDALPRAIGGVVPRLGASEVQNALDDFNQRWSASRAVLDSYMTALAKMGHDSVIQLRHTDHTLAQRAQPVQHQRWTNAD